MAQYDDEWHDRMAGAEALALELAAGGTPPAEALDQAASEAGAAPLDAPALLFLEGQLLDVLADMTAGPGHYWNGQGFTAAQAQALALEAHDRLEAGLQPGGWSW